MKKLLAFLLLLATPCFAATQHSIRAVDPGLTTGQCASAVSAYIVQSTGGGCGKQALLMASSATQAQNTTLYYPCSGNPAGGNATEANVSAPVPFAGTFKTIRGNATAMPGTGNTFLATLRLNGSDASLTCQTTASVVNCVGTGTVSASAGALCSVKITSSTTASAAAMSVGLEFDQ